MTNQDEIYEAIVNNNHNNLISLLNCDIDLNKSFVVIKDKTLDEESKKRMKLLLKDVKVVSSTTSKSYPHLNNKTDISVANSRLRILLMDDPKPMFLSLGNPISVASKKGFLDIVKTLLNNKTVDPTLNGNRAIIEADMYLQNDVVDVLWKDLRIKNTLEDDYSILYKKLKKQDIENTISHF